ncbi:MAG: hypothetical protein F4X64_17985 [Chloroflexi bacterium]|nr:hypothetical protein [Chloroflexota bacterium]
MPATLDENIAAYEKMKAYLEAEHFGKWALFYDEEFIDSYDEFEDAGYEAIKRFGLGPYHIRQVGVKRVIRLPFVVE